MPSRRAVVLVLDGVGAGGAPDASAYGDEGADTLRHTAEAAGGLRVPNLAALGLGNAVPGLLGVPPAAAPAAAHGLMQERSAAKASLTGHWEMMGIVSPDPLPTYPDGFPDAIVESFAAATGRGVLGNRPASGHDALQAFGPEHERTGKWILYTSADSVFQVAAHTGRVGVDELYAACATAHTMLIGDGRGAVVERVIARPFHGKAGAYVREESARRDFGMLPPRPTYLDAIAGAGQAVVAVGKVADIFGGRGITAHDPGAPDDAGKLDAVLRALASTARGLIFANLVDFDSEYGHRRDPLGMAANLAAFDRRLPELLSVLGEDDLLAVTADHGNDPTYRGTDHTRERVPLLVTGGGVGRRPLGVRGTYADLGASISAWLAVGRPGDVAGRSFL